MIHCIKAYLLNHLQDASVCYICDIKKFTTPFSSFIYKNEGRVVRDLMINLELDEATPPQWL